MATQHVPEDIEMESSSSDSESGMPSVNTRRPRRARQLPVRFRAHSDTDSENDDGGCVMHENPLTVVLALFYGWTAVIVASGSMCTVLSVTTLAHVSSFVTAVCELTS